MNVRSQVKWLPWIAPSTPVPTPETPTYAAAVGLFEGARYQATGMYRPRDRDYLMNLLGKPFGEICTQSYVLKLYQGGWGTPAAGIDPIEPGSENPPPGTVQTSGPLSLSVDLLAPVGGPPLDVSWRVDGVPQAGATGDTFVFNPPADGTYQVEIRVEDATSLVHPAMAGTALESSRSWTVNAATPVTPWQSNANGSLSTNIAWNYAMGYHFTPQVPGKVVELGGYFNGTKLVRLYNRTTGALLAETTVSAANNWSYSPITAVTTQPVTAYTVAVYLAGSGGSWRNGAGPFPQNYGPVTIDGTTYVSTATNPTARPTNNITNRMYGQADIKFLCNDPSQCVAPPLATPTGVSATDGTYPNRVRVTWSQVSGATHYKLFRHTANNTSAAIQVPAFIETGLFDDYTAVPGVTYWYWVKATNDEVDSDFSAPNTGFRRNDGQQTLTTAPVADAWVDQLTPTTNYGFTPDLRVRAAGTGQGKSTYLRFSVSGFFGTYQSAKLRIRTQGTDFPSSRVYRITSNSWNESTITWNNAPTTFSITYPTGNLAGNQWHEIDVTSLISGSGLYTIGLVAADEPNLAYWSRSSANAPSLIVTYQPPVTASFNPIADSWVNQLSPNTNYGSDTGLHVRSAATGRGNSGYLKFSVTGISGPVQSARLRLHTQGVSFPSARVYYIGSTSWTESGITWNNAPLNVILQFPIGALPANQWVEIDVSNIVFGNGTYTIGLVAADVPNLAYYSRESSFKPTLEVTYQP